MIININAGKYVLIYNDNFAIGDSKFSEVTVLLMSEVDWTMDGYMHHYKYNLHSCNFVPENEISCKDSELVKYMPSEFLDYLQHPANERNFDLYKN